MNKKPKLVYGIKGKLVSAACMLLVAVIMVVSSTYAWFTLSTAPEVTGISTAVGANGSLEMALVPSNGVLDDITTYTGTSVQDINRTWGNLVDLSASGYGLSQITLNPSSLNAEGNKIAITQPLATPVYGSDGRITAINPNTVVGTYVDQEFVANTEYGVRAVGVASGMTTRQLTYRTALSAANTAASKAKTLAAQSLSANGNTLANIAVARGLDKKEEFTANDLDALQKIVDDLRGTATKEGALQSLEKAYLNYILAIAASGSNQTAVSDDAVATLAAGIEAGTITLDHDDVKTYINADEALKTAVEKFNATVTTVEDAQTKITAAKESGDYTWLNTFSPILTSLANIDALTINGVTVASLSTDEGKNQLVTNVMGGGQGISVEMASGGGVYADIADHCGNYNASIKIEKLQYGEMQLTDVPANMTTKTSVTPSYASEVSTVASQKGDPATGNGSTTNPMTEFYGYIIDMAFRTNAAESDLLLQTAPVDRIYSEQGEDITMGHGSTMSFTSQSTNYSTTQMKELMANLRVVFFEMVDGQAVILGEARLDTVTAQVNDSTVTANLYLYKNDAFVTTQSEAVIKPLTQNQAHMVSALVYLDGAGVENADVAAEVAQSMVGTMNLQFSSSAQLVPMDYSFSEGESGTQTPATPTIENLTLTGTESKAISAENATTYKIVTSTAPYTEATSDYITLSNTDSTFTVTGKAAGEAYVAAFDENNNPIKVWKITVTEATSGT